MCGRYTIVTKLKAIEKRFNVLAKEPELYNRNTNVSAGELAPVITSEYPNQLQFFKFGFTPSWAKKETYTLNARAEGNYNKENRTDYIGNLGIISKPYFRKAIRSQRCLIPADCFIEGPQKERLNKPYVVYLREVKRPFAFAGLYDKWINERTGEVIHSFAIITIFANELLTRIGHHRSPVILETENEKEWIDSSIPLHDVTKMLKPFSSNSMNAYPISAAIKKSNANGTELLKPIGQRLIKEYDYVVYKDLVLEGMGMTTARRRKMDEEGQRKEGIQGSLPFE